MASKSQSIKQPFSNVQLELLKVFAHHVSDNDLIDLRQVLADFFSKKAVAAADAAWDKNGWSETDVQRLLTTKLRKSNKTTKQNPE
jgi:hypothetical protein